MFAQSEKIGGSSHIHHGRRPARIASITANVMMLKRIENCQGRSESIDRSATNAAASNPAIRTNLGSRLTSSRCSATAIAYVVTAEDPDSHQSERAEYTVNQNLEKPTISHPGTPVAEGRERV